MDAVAAANYMLYIVGEAFDDLTNMKLNKLLYFAQGYYMRKYGKPLFPDKIEAWEHGPVIPAVYSKFKQYGDKPIRGCDIAAVPDVSPEAEDILFKVAKKYGKYTASALRNMTHVIGSPWDQFYQKGRVHTEIPQASILAYFSDADDLNAETKTFKESDFIGYRDADGILVLPKEWDDGEV